MWQSDAERMRIRALARWEGEGGALGKPGSTAGNADLYPPAADRGEAAMPNLIFPSPLSWAPTSGAAPR
jgi:hypothetical protein